MRWNGVYEGVNVEVTESESIVNRHIDRPGLSSVRDGGRIVLMDLGASKFFLLRCVTHSGIQSMYLRYQLQTDFLRVARLP